MGKRSRQEEDVRNRTNASDPGMIELSDTKLRLLRPDLYGLHGLWRFLRWRLTSWFSWDERLHIKNQLMYGDSRAAVVVSTFPLMVAAYTDELDCVAILNFPDIVAEKYNLTEKSILLTVNYYMPGDEYASDLIPGPKNTETWANFHPLIAEFLTDDYARVKARKSQISREEWERTYRMGKEYLKLRPWTARDGSPIASSVPGITIDPSEYYRIANQ